MPDAAEEFERLVSLRWQLFFACYCGTACWFARWREAEEDDRPYA